MMKSVWAVIAGFLFILVLSLGTDAIMHAVAPRLFDVRGGTHDLVVLVLMIVYVGVFATVGSYITARLAPSSPMKHALVLGALGLLFTIIGTSRMWDMA